MLANRIYILVIPALAVMYQCAQANPSGPEVVHGSASFAQPNANVLNVTNSHNAVINWQSFNIGQGQTTNFIQPSSASAVLNHVLSNNPSQIHGNLNSNGRVFVINQHGLMIGAGAQINTAGFFGSTLNITNEDFLSGRLKFEGGGFGGIENYGYIHAGSGGNVVLIAPDIENGGVIEVDNGNVILAAGESITITSLNDASVEFEVQSDDNSVINLGDIIAHQGAVSLFAGNLQHSGAINATGIVQNADGSISLVAQQTIEVSDGATLNVDGADGGSIRVQSHHGDVYFNGTASAQGDSGKGGMIEILGERVGLFGAAVVNASGNSGGGEVLIGGDFQGKGDTQTATQTQVGENASIHADAIASGDGGKVIVWADDFTLFNGEASATAGASSGDGGFIEISGKGNLGYYGSVDASAASGNGGTILFDPTDIIFQISGGTLTLPANPLTFVTNPGATLTLAPSAITDITMTSASVIIQADKDITINDDIITVEGGSGGDITFQAGQSIFINADIFTDNGNLKLYANAAGANPVTRGGGQAEIVVDPLLVIAPPITLDAGTGTIELWMDTGVAGTSGSITVENLIADHILIKHNGIDPAGSIFQTGGLINALSLFIDHDGPAGGSVGSAGQPLNLRVDNLGAHIHEPTTNGIYIDATSGTGTVTIGGTCYGAGLTPCNTFPAHTVLGLETILGGGFIALSVVGDLFVAEQIRADDVQGTTNPGNISLSATGTILSDSNIFNNIPGGVIDFNSAFNILLNSGTYGGTITSASTGIPQINGAVTFDKVILDSDAVVFNANTLTLVDSLDIASGRVLVLGSTGTVTTLTTASPTVALNGPGFLTLGGTTVNNHVIVGPNTTFSIAANMTVTGQGVIDASDPTSTLINNGAIVSGGTGLTLDAANWNNNGSVSAASLSILTLVGDTLINDGSMTVEAGSFIDTLNQNFVNIPGAFFEGSGAINLGTATFDNQGTVSPGIGANDTGKLTINGNYTAASTSILNIELQGTSAGGPGPGFHDQLAISGSATLDGSLNVSNIGGYVPNPLDTFGVVTYGSLMPSAIAVENLPANFDPVIYGATSVDLLFNPLGAGFFWDGGGDGSSWSDQFNWFGDMVPTIVDDVTIGSFNVTVGAGGDANSLSLAAGGSLNLTGGTLTTNELVLNGNLNLAIGATLDVQDGVQPNDLTVNPLGALIVNGGNLTSRGNSLFNGSYLQFAGSANFTGSVAFIGPFDLRGGSLDLTNGASLAGLNNSWSGGKISGGAPLLLSGIPGATTLTLAGAADKTLDGITLTMNLNDVNVFGAGNLVLKNNATIDNSGGFSFNHFGNGDIIDGLGGLNQFINNSGAFNNISGDTTVTVSFVNDPSSQVNVLSGSLVMQDASAPTDPGNYNVAGGALVFSSDRNLAGSLNSTGFVAVNNGATLTLPAVINNAGVIGLDNAVLSLANLGGTLQLDASILGGTGTVIGNVVNNTGRLTVGGAATIGNLTISGNYTQNAAAAMVIKVFNNGFNSVSDLLTVTGATQLDGALVVGFATSSLGLVTSNFIPFDFQGGLTGSFSQVIDAGGNILGFRFNPPVFTILGVSPLVPQAVIDDLIKFIQLSEALQQTIKTNRAKSEAIIEAMLEQPEEDDEASLLICK